MLSKPENIREKIVQGRLDKMVNEKALLKQPFIKDTSVTVEEYIKQATAEIGEKISIRRFVKYNLGEGLEKREEDFAAEVEAQTKALAEKAAAKKDEEPKEEAKEAKEEAKPAVAVSAKLVKELRDKSGAGMMDCKKALGECNGDIEEATVWLRKKGMASADKKASRIAAEGAVAQYIHAGARLGVLVEVNCETDFVARGDKFKELVADIAMQVAACPEIEYVSPDDADATMIEKEREVQLKMEDILSKPENIREKIVQGRLDKMVNEKALLKQDFIKDTSKTVEELIKEATAEIDEKISIRRFVKYNLGEGLEKRERRNFSPPRWRRRWGSKLPDASILSTPRSPACYTTNVLVITPFLVESARELEEAEGLERGAPADLLISQQNCSQQNASPFRHPLAPPPAPVSSSRHWRSREHGDDDPTAGVGSGGVGDPAASSNLAGPPAPGRSDLRLVDERGEWCASERLSRHVLSDNADFTVVGVVGTQGSGKARSWGTSRDFPRSAARSRATRPSRHPPRAHPRREPRRRRRRLSPSPHSPSAPSTSRSAAATVRRRAR